jgi:hypothetical protein
MADRQVYLEFRGRRKLIRMSNGDFIRSGDFPIQRVLGQRVPAQVDSAGASEGCARWDHQRFLACGNRRTSPRRAQSY